MQTQVHRIARPLRTRTCARTYTYITNAHTHAHFQEHACHSYSQTPHSRVCMRAHKHKERSTYASSIKTLSSTQARTSLYFSKYSVVFCCFFFFVVCVCVCFFCLLFFVLFFFFLFFFSFFFFFGFCAQFISRFYLSFVITFRYFVTWF